MIGVAGLVLRAVVVRAGWALLLAHLPGSRASACLCLACSPAALPVQET